MINISDELINKVKKQDRKAQLELYRICFNDLMSVAYRYNENEEDAASLVNSSFLKIIDNLYKYNRIKHFKAWIRRIAINEAIDDYRRNKKRNELFVDIEKIESTPTESYNEIDKNIEAEELNNMLLKLPKATRTVFSLIAIDGYTHKEISKRLSISLETSKWHMKEARKSLKIMITQKTHKSEV